MKIFQFHGIQPKLQGNIKDMSPISTQRYGYGSVKGNKEPIGANNNNIVEWLTNKQKRRQMIRNDRIVEFVICLNHKA